MNYKELKKSLLNYQHRENQLRNWEKEIADLEENKNCMRNVSGVNYDGMPKGNSTSDETYSKAQKIVDDYEERVDELVERTRKMFAEQNRVRDIVSRLNLDEQKVIRTRYFDGIKWDYVPSRVNMSRANCFRIHDIAMQKMLSYID